MITSVLTHLTTLLIRYRTARDVRELRRDGIRRRGAGMVYREMG